MDHPVNPAIPFVEIGEEFHAGDKVGCAAFTMMCRGECLDYPNTPVMRVFLRHQDMRIYNEIQLISTPGYWHTKKECPNHE